MAKYCSDCTYLDPSSDSKSPGLYKCKKNKKDVLGNLSACDKFSPAYSRGWYEKEEIYDKGKNFDPPMKGTVGGELFKLIAIIIIGIILVIIYT